MSRTQCENPPMFRYTWPGKREQYICAIHAIQVQQIAAAIGLPLQFILLDPEEMAQHQCHQESWKGPDDPEEQKQ